MNRFDKAAQANKEAENIKSTEIDHALSMLRNSGKMGDRQQCHAVEAIRRSAKRSSGEARDRRTGRSRRKQAGLKKTAEGSRRIGMPKNRPWKTTSGGAYATDKRRSALEAEGGSAKRQRRHSLHNAKDKEREAEESWASAMFDKADTNGQREGGGWHRRPGSGLHIACVTFG
jgi:hypothetical protein